MRFAPVTVARHQCHGIKTTKKTVTGSRLTPVAFVISRLSCIWFDIVFSSGIRGRCRSRESAALASLTGVVVPACPARPQLIDFCFFEKKAGDDGGGF